MWGFGKVHFVYNNIKSMLDYLIHLLYNNFGLGFECGLEIEYRGFIYGRNINLER
jgi:hypothetical protein